eukprot:363526-Chlamydomonas_euryale.AAC.5
MEASTAAGGPRPQQEEGPAGEVSTSGMAAGAAALPPRHVREVWTCRACCAAHAVPTCMLACLHACKRVYVHAAHARMGVCSDAWMHI